MICKQGKYEKKKRILRISVYIKRIYNKFYQNKTLYVIISL